MAVKQEEKLLKPIQEKRLRLRIVGKSPLIVHSWSEKAKKEIRDKKMGKKTRNREACDPKAEFEAAQYRTEDGQHGIRLEAIKKSIITAAHKDLGIPRTLVMKALFVLCGDSGGILPLDPQHEPTMREDAVTVGNRGTDLRYRPEYWPWGVILECEIDTECLTLDDVLTLINRAGFGIGVGEWRPEKGGDYGRYEVDTDFGVEEVA